jgi:hypothetical protein
MYTSEFAARLRRMDEDRSRIHGAANIIEFAWSNRLARLPPSPQSMTAGRMEDR